MNDYVITNYMIISEDTEEELSEKVVRKLNDNGKSEVGMWQPLGGISVCKNTTHSHNMYRQTMAKYERL